MSKILLTEDEAEKVASQLKAITAFLKEKGVPYSFMVQLEAKDDVAVSMVYSSLAPKEIAPEEIDPGFCWRMSRLTTTRRCRWRR